MTIRKKPLVIEFTGPPNSGKTSTIYSLKSKLEDMGFKVDVKQEDAEIVPKEIPKKTWERNMWIASGQIQSLLEAQYSSSDVVFLDRGYFDALFWADFLKFQNICSPNEAYNLKKFLVSLDESFNCKPDFLFVIDVSTEESLRRRYAMEGTDAPVLSTNNFIDTYKEMLNNFCMDVDTLLYIVNTTYCTQDDVVKNVLSILLDTFDLK